MFCFTCDHRDMDPHSLGTPGGTEYGRYKTKEEENNTASHEPGAQKFLFIYVYFFSFIFFPLLTTHPPLRVVLLPICIYQPHNLPTYMMNPVSVCVLRRKVNRPIPTSYLRPRPSLS